MKTPLSAPSVAQVLIMAEEQYPGVGMCLAPSFSPEPMRVNEPEHSEFWREAQKGRWAANQHETPIDVASLVYKSEAERVEYISRKLLNSIYKGRLMMAVRPAMKDFT